MTDNNAKGRIAENQSVRYLRDSGFVFAERRAKFGTNDRGDIVGVIGVTFQVKDVAKPNFEKWFKDVVEQAKRDNDSLPVLIHKRRNCQTKNWDMYIQISWLMQSNMFGPHEFARVSFEQGCAILAARGYQ